MKETISVNLASQAFTFDKDAYRRLKEYLDAIRRRLPAGDPEILNDVEARLAEIFRSRISSPMMVVTLQMVQGAMAQMGDPSEFGGLSLWVYIILWIVIPSEPLNCISSKSKNLF